MPFHTTSVFAIASLLVITSAEGTTQSCSTITSGAAKSVCCDTEITFSSGNNGTNVCCNGSVFGSYNTDTTSLLDAHNNLTWCGGDTNIQYLVSNASSCTAGTPTPMRDIATSQGVEQSTTATATSTSSALGAIYTGDMILGMMARG